MRRARDDRGVALVEAVFVLPVMLTVVLAIFEFGLLFAAQSTTNYATRDGVRFGSANFAVSGSNKAAADAIAAAVAKDLGARTNLDTPIKLWIYKANSNGFPSNLSDFSSCAANCFRYTWSSGAFVYDNTSPTWTDAINACIDPTNGLNTLDAIGAYLELSHKYITGAFGTTQLIKEHTVSRLEPLPLSQC